MVKYLKDCNIGDKVKLWCIGIRSWDDVFVKIIDNSSLLIKVQYPSGRYSEFLPNTECYVE